MNRLFGEDWELFKNGGRKLVLFEVAYKMIVTTILYPLLLLLLYAGLKIAGVHYLTNEYIARFATNPFVILTLLAGILLAGAYLIYEMIFISLCYEFKMKDKDVSFLENIVTSARIFKGIFNRKNWLLAPFAVLSCFTLNIVVVINVIFSGANNQLWKTYASQIPFEIWILIILLGAGVLFLVIAGCFSINEFVLEGKTFRKSFKKSCQLVRQNLFRVVFTLIFYNLCILALIGVIYVVLSVILIAGVRLLNLAYIGSAVYLSTLRTIRAGIKLLLCYLAVPCSYTVVSRLYYRVCKDDEYQFEPVRIVEKRPIRNRLVCTWILIFSIIINIVYVISAFNLNPFDKVAIFSGVQISSHRGNSKDAPENTMAAFEKAIQDMTDYIELDVQQTSDGAVIVMHDSSVKRTTGVDKEVWELTLDEVKQLDAGSSFSPEYAGEPVPTLDEVIKMVKGKAKLNIEIKPNSHDVNMAESVAQIIEDNDFTGECVVTSFDYQTLKEIKQINPDIEVGYILSVAYGDFYNMDDVDVFSVNASFLTKRTIDAIHKSGKRVFAWTVNNETSMKNLANKGVDNIITDDPITAREVIYSRNTSETLRNMLNYVFNK